MIRQKTQWKNEDPVEVVLVFFLILGYFFVLPLADCGVSAEPAEPEVISDAVVQE